MANQSVVMPGLRAGSARFRPTVRVRIDPVEVVLSDFRIDRTSGTPVAVKLPDRIQVLTDFRTRYGVLADGSEFSLGRTNAVGLEDAIRRYWIKLYYSERESWPRFVPKWRWMVPWLAKYYKIRIEGGEFKPLEAMKK